MDITNVDIHQSYTGMTYYRTPASLAHFLQPLFFESHLNVVKRIKATVLNKKHTSGAQALPLEQCSGLIRTYVFATDMNTEQYEKDCYGKTFTCYSQMHRFKSDQNCGNENSCNPRYALRKQDSTYDEVA
jgi:hypothetical protein